MKRNIAAKADEDRRQAPRVDIYGQYTIRLDPLDGREPIVCPMLDFSVTGFRLELAEDVALPADVQIVIGSLSHNARVIWRKGDVVGVDLIDEHHSLHY